jgi:hypothetical protein
MPAATVQIESGVEVYEAAHRLRHLPPSWLPLLRTPYRTRVLLPQLGHHPNRTHRTPPRLLRPFLPVPRCAIQRLRCSLGPTKDGGAEWDELADGIGLL